MFENVEALSQRAIELMDGGLRDRFIADLPSHIADRLTEWKFLFTGFKLCNTFTNASTDEDFMRAMLEEGTYGAQILVSLNKPAREGFGRNGGNEQAIWHANVPNKSGVPQPFDRHSSAGLPLSTSDEELHEQLVTAGNLLVKMLRNAY